MKLLIVLLSVVAFSCAAPSGQLIQDFREFFVALPVTEVRKIANEHLQSDPEYQAAIKHVQSTEFKKMTRNLTQKPSVKEAKLIVREAGLDVELFERVMEVYIDSLVVNVADNQKRSFGKFIEEVNAIMPWDKLMDLLAYKLEHSEAFKTFFEAISSERMKMLVDKMLRSQEFRVLAKEMVAMDVPLYETIEAGYGIMGWKTYKDTPNDLDE